MKSLLLIILLVSFYSQLAVAIETYECSQIDQSGNMYLEKPHSVTVYSLHAELDTKDEIVELDQLGDSGAQRSIYLSSMDDNRRMGYVFYRTPKILAVIDRLSGFEPFNFQCF